MLIFQWLCSTAVSLAVLNSPLGRPVYLGPETVVSEADLASEVELGPPAISQSAAEWSL